MKRTLFYVLLIALIVSANAGFSQVTEAIQYAFSTSFQTYDTVVAGTTLTNLNADDNTQQNVPIGFTFNYCGVNYTQLSVGDNGWVSLSNAPGADDTYGANSDYHTTQAELGYTRLNAGVGFLMAYWFDLYALVGGPNFAPGACTTDIVARYATTGTAPNRIFTVEWHNFGVYNWGGYTGCGSIELKLHETTGTIDFCYGSTSWNGHGAIIGIANSATDFQIVTTPGSYPTTTTVFDSAKSTPPADGTVYSWCPSNINPKLTDNSPVCSGNTANFTVTTGTGAAEYSWVGPNGYTSSSASTGNVSIAGISTLSSGVYTFTATNGACLANDTISLVVNPTPVITGLDSFCKGSTATMTVSVTGGTWSSTNPGVASVSAGGIVTALHKGTTTISYTLPTGCDAGHPIVIDSTAFVDAITGSDSVCVNSSVTLSNVINSGVWSSADVATATVNASTGIVTGVAAGTTHITYTFTNTCSSSATSYSVTVDPLPNVGTITGTTTVCPTSTTQLTETGGIGTGTWSSSNTAIATVSGTGLVTGVATGSANITYTATSISGCGAVDTVIAITVEPLPNAGTISGTDSVCVSSSVLLTDAGSVGVGAWSSGNTAVATVDASGNVTGVAAGSANITYTVNNSCGTANTSYAITVDPTPNVGSVTGTTTVCPTSTTQLTETGGIGTGTWSSSNAAIATVDATGLVTGVSSGSANITYTATSISGCGAVDTVIAITVEPLPNAGTISGIDSVCVSSSVLLTDVGSVGVGAWTSDNTAISTVDASGNVSGVAAGNTTITYTVNNSCGTANTTFAITVDPSPNVGSVTGTTTVCPTSTTQLTETGGIGTGSWSSSNTAVATVDPTGLVTGVTSGAANITYTSTSISGCGSVDTVIAVIVEPLPNAGTINGTDSVCVFSSVLLTDVGSVGVGAWTSDNTAIATVDASGNVTGVTAGNTTITYTVNNSCGTANTTFAMTVDPGAGIGAVTGTNVVCVNATTQFTATGGIGTGTWTSDNTAIATVDATGLVTGVSHGLVNITYAVTSVSGCGVADTVIAVTVNPLPYAGVISGSDSVCNGASVLLVDGGSVGVGAWSSQNNSTATVDAFGNVTGVSPGTTNISFTVTNSCGTTDTFFAITVDPSATVGTITGTNTVCVNATTRFTESGGIGTGSWSSSNISIATVDATGLVTGVSAGSVNITYTAASISGCGSADSVIAVSVAPLPNHGSISGASSVCIIGSTSLTDVGGLGTGTWSSGNTAVATVSAGGLVIGVSAGVAAISYTSTNSCGITDTTINITVNPLAKTGTFTGPDSVCVGATTSFSITGSAAAGTWATSNAAIATVDATGTVTGIAAGNVNISYTAEDSTTCLSSDTVVAYTVDPLPNHGVISGLDSTCVGSSITLTDAGSVGVGTWTSGNIAIATVGATGVVTGVALGTTAITFTATNSCGAADTFYSVKVSSSLTAGAITGIDSVCIGFNTVLIPSVSGGTWVSGNTAIATVNSFGVVTGVSAGNVNITYQISSSCGTVDTFMTVQVENLPNPGIITGTLTACVGATTSLTDTTHGGVWSSGNTAIATVSATGIVTGIATGNTNIHYTVTNACGAGDATVSVAVNPLPDGGVINGPKTVCAGTTITLTDTVSGGTWSTGNAALATVAGGVVTGVTPGVVVIGYKDSNSCGTATTNDTITVITVLNAGTISGTATVCAGSTTVLTDTASGSLGVWSSSNTAVATVSAGTVTGIAGGVATITYAVTNTCGTKDTTLTVNVTPLPSSGSITGLTTLCVNAVSTLTDTSDGGAGTWSSSAIAVASVSATGVITGMSAGSAVISYMVTNLCGSAVSTVNVTVNPLPNAGVISGTDSVCLGSTTPLTDAGSLGIGVWSSSNTAIASVSGSGVVTGIEAGIATITYATTNSCGTKDTTYSVKVNALPNPGIISGNRDVCFGFTTTLTDSNSVGVGSWSSSNTSIAMVNGSGVVTGITPGTVLISYTATNSCGAIADTFSVVVQGIPFAGVISGLTSFCAGATTSLSDPTPGGTWSSADSAIATVNSSGLVIGITGGNVVISYAVANSCGTRAATADVVVDPLPNPGVITGSPLLCLGSFDILTDTAAGGTGTWSSSNTAVATVSSAGVVSGVTLGNVTITYALTNSCGSRDTTFAMSIITLPNAGTITGIDSVCQAATISLSDTVSGGVWSVSNAGIATVSATGAVTGINLGTDTIFYSVTNTCGTVVTSFMVTVKPLPNAGTITGTFSVCAGSATTLSDAGSVGTGVWSSSNASVASVSASGIVSGNTAGIATITYAVTNSCGSMDTTTSFVVVPLPTPGTISGTDSVCVGATITLTDTTNPGAAVWSSSNTALATVSGGVVTGVSAGVDTIYYTVTTVCGTVNTSMVITVDPLPNAGVLNAPKTTVCAGSTILLTDTTSGGTWLSGDVGVANVTDGLVIGVVPGTSTIYYTVTNSCGLAYDSVTITVDSTPTVGAISGPTQLCQTTSATLSDPTLGGVWTSNNSSILTVGSSSGMITGINAGVDTVMYTVTNSYGCSADTMYVDTVNATPSAGMITAVTTTVCQGSSIVLVDTASGGTWLSSNVGIANVSGGIVTGITPGIATIYYFVSNGICTAIDSAAVTVNPTPVVGSISGAGSICQGNSATLTDVASGGTWSSSNNGVATIDPSIGALTSVGAGVDTITYTISNVYGCFASSSAIETVYPTPSAGFISAATTTVCQGNTIVLTDTASGGSGVWSSSNNSVSTVSGGIVTGVGAGIDTISYTVSNALGCNSSVSAAVTVNPIPSSAPISGPTTICVGSSVTLTDAASGGVWTSSDPSVSTVDPSLGIETGVNSGVDTIFYAISNIYGCSVVINITSTVMAMPVASPISGPASVCAGATVAFTDSMTGGTWSLSNGTVASVGATSGSVTGSVAGIDTLSYTVAASVGCNAVATTTFSVLPAPRVAPIDGMTSICVGAEATLTDDSAGGVWLSGDLTIATIDGTLGTVIGVNAGVDTIMYTVINSYGCTAMVSYIDTIVALPVVSAIQGPTSLCLGSSVTLTDSTSGGTWTSSNASVASVTSGGIVTGNTLGSVSIEYTAYNSLGCSTTVTQFDTVQTVPVPGTIIGSNVVCTNGTASLVDTPAGGIWTSSNTAIATVDPLSGIVTGVSSGTLTIVYTVSNGVGCTAFTTFTDSVMPVPVIDPISIGSSVLCTGNTTLVTDAMLGGYWTTTDSAVATVSISGVVTGVGGGIDTIVYNFVNGMGCLGTATTGITVDTVPAAVILPYGGASLCHGDPVNLVINTLATGLTYQWYMNGVAIAGATNGSYITDTVGLFTVEVNTSLGCSTMLSGTNVIGQPNPTIGLDHGNILYTDSFTTYQWLDDGTVIPGATNSTYLETASGDYAVIVTNQYGCSDTSMVFAVLKVNTITAAGINIGLFPNPATSTINIDAPMNVNARVSTVTGNELLYIKDTKTIDVSDLANGVYMIELFDKNNGQLLYTSKVVKMD